MEIDRPGQVPESVIPLRREALEHPSIDTMGAYIDKACSPFEEKLNQGQVLDDKDMATWQVVWCDLSSFNAGQPKSEDMRTLFCRVSDIRSSNDLLGRRQYESSLEQRFDILHEELQGEISPEDRVQKEIEIREVSRRLQILQQ